MRQRCDPQARARISSRHASDAPLSASVRRSCFAGLAPWLWYETAPQARETPGRQLGRSASDLSGNLQTGTSWERTAATITLLPPSRKTPPEPKFQRGFAAVVALSRPEAMDYFSEVLMLVKTP
jgi:hypothetical protein